MVTKCSMPQSTIIPELAYTNVVDAADWLVRVFGFKVRLRIRSYRIELSYEGGDLIVIEGAVSAQGSPSHRTIVRVVHVDAHCSHAMAAGGADLSVR